MYVHDAHRQDFRLHGIDISKGISILLVLTNHLDWTVLERKNLLFLYCVEMGVPFFMMISGYVGAVFLKRTGKETLQECYSAWGMLKKLTAYTVPFVLGVTMELVMKYLWSGQIYPVVRTFVCGGLGPGSYYYPCLVQFTFFFPVIFVIVNSRKEKGLLLLFFTNIMYEIIQSFYGLNESCYRLLFIRYLFCAAYGCFLALNETGGFYWYINLAAVLTGAVWIAITGYTDFEPVIFKYWSGTNVIASMFFAAVFRLGLTCFKNFRNPFMECIGKNTWYIFLVQMIFFSGIDKYFYKYLPRYPGFVAALVICIIGGIVCSFVCGPVVNWTESHLLSVLNRIRAKNIFRYIVK